MSVNFEQVFVFEDFQLDINYLSSLYHVDPNESFSKMILALHVSTTRSIHHYLFKNTILDSKEDSEALKLYRIYNPDFVHVLVHSTTGDCIIYCSKIKYCTILILHC